MRSGRASATLTWSIVPLLGSRTPEQIEEALGALSIELRDEEVARLEDTLPAEKVAGTRHDKYAMLHLDSER